MVIRGRGCHDDGVVPAIHDSSPRSCAGQFAFEVVWSSTAKDRCAIFQPTLLVEAVKAWQDRSFTYRGIPSELVGATLFAGARHMCPEGTLSIKAPTGSLLYIFSECHRDGGFPYLGWSPVDAGRFKWFNDERRGYQLSVWKRELTGYGTLEIPVTSPFIGGIALHSCGVRETGRSETEGADTTIGAQMVGTNSASCLSEFMQVASRIGSELESSSLRFVDELLERETRLDNFETPMLSHEERELRRALLDRLGRLHDDISLTTRVGASSLPVDCTGSSNDSDSSKQLFEAPPRLAEGKSVAVGGTVVWSTLVIPASLSAQVAVDEGAGSHGDVTRDFLPILQAYPGLTHAFKFGTVRLSDQNAPLPIGAKVHVRNAGGCAWPADAVLRIVAGSCHGLAELPLGVVAPGETVELILDLALEVTTGASSSAWAMCDGRGEPFGTLLLLQTEVA